MRLLYRPDARIAASICPVRSRAPRDEADPDSRRGRVTADRYRQCNYDLECSPSLISSSLELHRLANSKTLFVQQGARLAPQLDPPAARAVAVHDVATICAETETWTRLHAEVYRLVQAIVPIPTMLDGGGARGLDLSVEKQRARRNRTVRRIASPFLEIGTEPSPHHLWAFVRRHRDWTAADFIGGVFSASLRSLNG